MRFTTVLILVLVICAVAMAGKANKMRKKAEKKAERQAMKAKCTKTVTYSACVNNMMNRTIAPPEGVEGCKPAVVKSIPCTYTRNKTIGGCIIQQEFDFSGCGGSTEPKEKVLTITLIGDDCKGENKSPIKLPCDSKLMKGFKKELKQIVKGMKDGSKRGKREERCKYRRDTWSECDPVTNQKTMTRPLKSGSSTTCDPVQIIQRPCSKTKKKKSGGCKYKRGEWSQCDGATNIKTMVKELKRGDPNECEPTQTIEKICKRQHKGLNKNVRPKEKKAKCKYRKMEKWGPCDPEAGLKSRQMILKKGDPKKCEPKVTETRPCMKKKNGDQRKQKGCRYEKSHWGPCDASTNTVRRILNLKEGDPDKCNTTKLQVKKCKNRHLRPHICKYKRTTWEDCDPVTNMRVMIKTLKRGDPSKCEPTQTVEKKCKGKKKTSVCKYKYEPWEPCNVTTNTMTRRQVLKSGPESCQAVKEYSRKCKKPCKWDNGEWSECDPETNQMTRVDTLKKATDSSCPESRVLTKKCGKAKKCIYDSGTWSECDNTENPVRTRTQKLKSGGPGCEPEKITTKECTKKNGEVRCFFGPWQEYEKCRNGVQKKQRQVIQGGQECERKSVKMKPC